MIIKVYDDIVKAKWSNMVTKVQFDPDLAAKVTDSLTSTKTVTQPFA